MKPFTFYLCVLLLAYSMTSCNSVEPDNTFQEQARNIKIKPGDRKQLNSDIWVTFVERTGDSRCPVDVKCIWEGEVNLLFNVEGPLGTDTLRVKGFLGPAGEERISVGLPTASGYSINVHRLDPYPGTEAVETEATISLASSRAEEAS